MIVHRCSDQEEPRGKWLPALPRLVLNGMVLIPQTDANWVPLPDMWILPGGRLVNTQQVEVLAEENGWTLARLG